MTRRESFEIVANHLRSLPSDRVVYVVGTHADLASRKVVQLDEVFALQKRFRFKAFETSIFLDEIDGIMSELVRDAVEKRYLDGK